MTTFTQSQTSQIRLFNTNPIVEIKSVHVKEETKRMFKRKRT